MIWLLTCEHHGNVIPPDFAHLFAKAGDVLQSHRGYDLRVSSLYNHLQPLFNGSFSYPYSRLLIEPNRSLHHRQLFSPFTIQLDQSQKAALISDHYLPYRNKVEKYIKDNIQHGVIHVSVHSFTPVLGNQVREAGVGILFDPGRRPEKELASLWKHEFRILNPDLGVRFNYPYRGIADGFTTYLRKQFPVKYVGLELEVRNDLIPDLNRDVYNSLMGVQGVIQ